MMSKVPDTEEEDTVISPVVGLTVIQGRRLVQSLLAPS